MNDEEDLQVDGDALRRARLAANFTSISEAARQAGVDRSHLSDLELGKAGKKRGASPKTLGRLAKLYNVDVRQFLVRRNRTMAEWTQDVARLGAEAARLADEVALDDVPLLGNYPSDIPIERQQKEGQLVVRRNLLQLAHASPETYAVSVNGNCLDTAGIHSGNHVLVDPKAEFLDGKLYLLWVDNKRLIRYVRKVEGQLLIGSTDGKYQTVSPDAVKVLGRIIAVDASKLL